MTGRSAWGAAGVIGLIVSIAALAILFLYAVDRGALYFARAAASQDQFAQVLAMREASRSGDVVRQQSALARYRDSIAAEEQLLSSKERAAQASERADYRALASAMAAPGPAFEQIVERIGRRERSEAAESAGRMANLHRNTRLLAMLLAGSAILSAVIGGIGLASANRRLAKAVTARTAQIAAVDASRRLFYAKISHELKTPVTIVRGEAEVALATGRDDPLVLAAALREVVAHAELLTRRVEELLALSQAEDGRLDLAQDPLNLTDVAFNAVAQVERYAHSNRVTLEVAASDEITMNGDARWLAQAVVAVLDNAIKFSPEDSLIRLEVMRTEPTQAVVRIEDRGPGVARGSLPQLFDAYYQTEEGRLRGGNGLGLALASWVVEQHGGTVDAAIREGGGCVVTLKFPVAA